MDQAAVRGRAALFEEGAEDGLADAVVPAAGVPDGEDDLGVGVVRGQFAPVRGGGPVDGGPEPGEQRVPVAGTALTDVEPLPHPVRLGDDGRHVVAGPEAQ